jgi:Spy/CpxP family protein refolding chaperone
MIAKGSCVSLRRGLLIAGILAATCSALWAQDGSQPDSPAAGQWGRHGGNPERELQQLTERLQLTTDQQTQVKSLLAERRQKMDELRRSSSGSDSSAQTAPPGREQMEALRNDTDTKISALLNQDQKAKFAEWQQERKARMERHQGPGGDNPPPPPPPGN